ncbi:MAG: hypothetical protein AB1566_04350 [Chloroflexota bacterium]
MFDLERLKITSGLAPDIFARVEQKVREDFHDDEMMFELHLVRIIQALKEGRVTLEQVLAEKIPA